MPQIGCIYIIKNKCNNKVYIGQTTQGVLNRWKQHCKPSEHKRHNYKLYKAMDKYGIENFYYEIIEDNILYEKLDKKEIYYIEKFNSYKQGYNSTKGGDGKTFNKIQDIENIIIKLKNGELLKDIAKEYNVNTSTIRRNLQSIGINSPSKIQGVRKIKSLQIAPRNQIIKLYKLGWSYKDIAREENINERTISRIIKEFGIGKRNMIDYNLLPLNEVLQEFEKYNNGLIKKKDVLKKYGLNQHSLLIIKKMNGVNK